MLSIFKTARCTSRVNSAQALYSLAARYKSIGVLDEDYQFLQKSDTPTDHFQKSLMRLPIPPLTKTCERYLKAVEPLLSTHEYQRTKLAVQKFMEKDGKELDNLLKNEDYMNKDTSYISGPWFDMYLRDRVPLPINYNPIIAYVDDKRPGYNQLIRATNMLISSLRFCRSFRSNCLAPEVYHINPKKSDNDRFRTVTRLAPRLFASYVALAFQAVPLDMSQFPGLFNATRIPQPTKDTIARHPDARHMLVMKNGHFYVFDVFDNDGNILPAEDIYACMKQISEDRTPPPEFPLGLLTTTNRDVWAENRRHLENIGNTEALSLIDSGFFCLCLDNESLDSLEETFRCFLHSDGVNRWFDKSISLLFDKNGRASVNFEHSWGDGVAVLRFFKDIYNDYQERPFITPESVPSKQPGSQVRRLEFNLDDKAKAAITTAKHNYQKICKSLDVGLFKYEGFGKELCKETKMSPDGIMQLGFQLANRQLSGKYVGHYESCSTAMFKHGRTETVRPCTSVVKRFCESVLHPQEKSADELRHLLKLCCDTHNQLIKEAATGHGMDRHLFALRKIAESAGSDLPDLYKDLAYTLINTNILSTSTLNAPMVLIGGFGAVVPNGYGLGYHMKDDMLGAVVTNYAEHTSNSEFVQSLADAFEKINKVLRKTLTT